MLALAHDALGGLWIGAAKGLDYLESGASNFKHFRPSGSEKPDPKASSVQSLLIDQQKNLWIGTANGMTQWTSSTRWESRKQLSSPDGITPLEVSTIYQDRDSVIWVGSDGNGLMRWDTLSTKRSVSFDYDVFSVKPDLIQMLELHGKYLASNPKLSTRS